MTISMRDNIAVQKKVELIYDQNTKRDETKEQEAVVMVLGKKEMMYKYHKTTNQWWKHMTQPKWDTVVIEHDYNGYSYLIL